METRFGLFSDTAERLPALILAVVATFLVFAAINAAFTAQRADLTGRVALLAAQPALDSRI